MANGFKSAADGLLRQLKALEWALLDPTGKDTDVRACPVCNGFDPETVSGDVGHDAGCQLNAAIASYEAASSTTGMVATLQHISVTMEQVEEIGGEWDEERRQIADIISQLS